MRWAHFLSFCYQAIRELKKNLIIAITRQGNCNYFTIFPGIALFLSVWACLCWESAVHLPRPSCFLCFSCLISPGSLLLPCLCVCLPPSAGRSRCYLVLHLRLLISYSHTCRSSAHLASTTCFSIKRPVILPVFAELPISLCDPNILSGPALSFISFGGFI